MTENRRYLELLIATIIIVGFFALLFLRSDQLVKGAGNLVHVLKPFIYGFVIAYLLMPLMNIIEKWMIKLFPGRFRDHASLLRVVSITITFILVLFLIVQLVNAVLPGLVSSMQTLIKEFPGAYRRFERWITGLLGNGDNEINSFITESMGDVYDKLYESIRDSLLPNLENITSTLSAGFGGVLGVLKNAFLGCVVAVYMLASWEKFGAQARIMLYGLVSESTADWISKELSLTDRLFGGFISGKIIDSAIIGVICFVGCAVLQMPYALLVSVIVGVTNIIPFFGPYIGAVPSAILILINSPAKCIIFVVFILILQQLDGHVIGPKILGNRVGISSFWVFFAILFFGSYWGIVGMVVGVPVFGVLYDLAKRIIQYGIQKHGKTEMLAEYRKKYEEPVKKTKRESVFKKLMQGKV